MGEFVHLHLHTEYSLLDGCARISEIADKALSVGQDAVAITDHGVMYGAVHFYNEMKAKGIKPIIGCEVYVAPRSRFDKEGKADSSGHHLVLLCKNEEGYRTLCYLVSKSFVEGFYSRPRIDMELLRERHEGLICLSGCLAGKIPQLILSGSMDEAQRCANEFKSIFGDDFYLEVQNHSLDDERRVAYGIRLISERCDIPMVATNDVHYIERSDADTQATLLCIQTGNVITDGRPIGFDTDEYYFKTDQEMKNLFSQYKGAVENTVKIAEKCNFDFEFNKLHLPDFTSGDGVSHKDKLYSDAYLGFERKINEGKIDFSTHGREEYLSRIEYELSVIDKMGFNAYYLIVADFVNYAKKSGIPVGPGRGSGAGSLVAYLVGITDVDPIEYDLLFERFLNPERVSMPDFDIDFCYNRREEVIDYVKRKYGDDKVSQIVTFGTLAPRAAIRDVGRALGMPYPTVDTVAKLVPMMCPSLDVALSQKELLSLYQSDASVKRLVDTAKKLEGMPRHASTHAAGVVITERPTYEYVPLSYSGTGVVTQFDMNTAATLGLVKFDFLGLRYITVVSDAERAIRLSDKDFDITRIPLDDKETYKLLCDGRTDGVFQLESGGMKQVLSKLKPNCIEDIIATVALYRPGPMDSINTFIARKHGVERVEYKLPELRPILDVTYGCIVYQEQVMQICRSLAGYSYARADVVRRAMSKKKTSAMQAEREDFLSGARDRGIDERAADEVFSEMLGFAKYAFNKSHATAYAMISYRTAYLKAHYPKEYFAALLTSVLNNSTGVKEYISDAQKFGVSVLPPDINSSSTTFAVDGDNIRFGLLAIKNVGRLFADAVIKERGRGRFKSFDDFVSRMIDSDINKRTLESMIKCGVFDSLGVTRSALLMCYESILDSEHTKVRNNISGQLDLFSIASTDTSVSYTYPKVNEFSIKELLLLEKESSGMYFSGHMIDGYSRALSEMKYDKISDILSSFTDDTGSEPKFKDGDRVAICGIINTLKKRAVKSGDTMASLVVEDRFAEIEVIAFPKQYKSCETLLEEERCVLIEGAISLEENEVPRIFLRAVKEVTPDSEYGNRTSESPPKADKKMYIRVPKFPDASLENYLNRMSTLYSGDCQIVLYDTSTGKYLQNKAYKVNLTDSLIEKFETRFSKNNIVIK